MNDDEGTVVEQQLELELAAIARSVRELAKRHQGDSIAILALLRSLEQLHQEIRDTLFQESLPDNRQALYRLLRNIEAAGGWPYIHRMKLQSFLAKLQSNQDGEDLDSIRPPIDGSPEFKTSQK
jgi:hypothetical protein